MQYSLVGSRFVLQYKLYCEPGWACVMIQHGLGSWGAGVGAGERRRGELGMRGARRRALAGAGRWTCGKSRRRQAAGAGARWERQQARGEQQQARRARRTRSRRADTALTLGGARHAQAGARGAAGWAACARLVCSAGPGWVFWCT